MGAVEIDRAVTTERFRVSGMTCGSCVRHVEDALAGVPGVWLAEVSLNAATATVVRNSALASLEALQAAVAEAGYKLEPLGDAMTDEPFEGTRIQSPGSSLPLRPMVFGSLAALSLLGLYLGLVTLAQGLDHARQLLFEDRYFVGALSLGFGTQVALFVYLRGLHGRASTSGLAASTGTSTTAMLACCAHHLTEILPILGVSGAAAFLGAYKTELLWVGLGMNLMGVSYMLWRVRQARRMACPEPMPRASAKEVPAC